MLLSELEIGVEYAFDNMPGGRGLPDRETLRRVRVTELVRVPGKKARQPHVEVVDERPLPLPHNQWDSRVPALVDPAGAVAPKYLLCRWEDLDSRYETAEAIDRVNAQREAEQRQVTSELAREIFQRDDIQFVDSYTSKVKPVQPPGRPQTYESRFSVILSERQIRAVLALDPESQ